MLKEIISGAIGYGIASAQGSTAVGDVIDNFFKSMTLEDIIKNYANKHLDVYTCDNAFAKRLHLIARQYEEYDYEEHFER